MNVCVFMWSVLLTGTIFTTLQGGQKTATFFIAITFVLYSQPIFIYLAHIYTI